MNWTRHETWLVTRAVSGIALIVVLISVLKVHAFIALVLGSCMETILSVVGLALILVVNLVVA